ncbi:hypothetical protein JNM05_15865 [bacterium]|nr:hypothetical protein [bacterium]
MMTITESTDGELMTMKSKNIFRTIGIVALFLIVMVVAYIFYDPTILMGVAGIFVPVSLFILLLLAFYLLILSTKY